jgi:hypothetical protein
MVYNTNMAKTRKPQKPRETPATIEKRVCAAAHLLGHGISWQQIADKMGYADKSGPQKLKKNHKALFNKEFNAARMEYIHEIETKALNVMQNLLDGCSDDYARERAAHSILKHAASLRAREINVSGGVDNTLTVNVINGAKKLLANKDDTKDYIDVPVDTDQDE